MFSSAAIEVVIGLAFIYILYSLLVTIITELITSLLNQRGRVLKKGLKRMLDDEDKKIFSEEFLNRAEIKYLSNKGRLPSYLKPTTFSKTLMNVLGKADNAKKFLENKIKELKEKLDKNPDKKLSDTEEVIYNLMLEADGNIELFKSLLEEWYNETMERVAGWYKRRIQVITFVIGILLAFAMNVDTIAIAKKLTNESDARMEMVKVATAYVNEQNPDSSISDSLYVEMKKVVGSIKNQESIISISRPKCDSGFKVIMLYIIGCFITAIALSLGAPFWFDILDKLVKLRSSGAQEKIADTKDQSSEKQKKKKNIFTQRKQT